MLREHPQICICVETCVSNFRLPGLEKAVPVGNQRLEINFARGYERDGQRVVAKLPNWLELESGFAENEAYPVAE